MAATVYARQVLMGGGGAGGGGAAGGALRDTVWIEAATMTCKSKLWQPWHKYL